MTSFDGPEQSSMEDILASIRKIIATEPASETQAAAAEQPPSTPLNRQLARDSSALPSRMLGTELPRGPREDADKKFFTPLPERASPLFSRPARREEAEAGTSPARAPVEHDLADLLEDFGAASPETEAQTPAEQPAEADQSQSVAEAQTAEADGRRADVPEAPNRKRAGEGAEYTIDFSVLARMPEPELETAPVSEIAPITPQAPQASQGEDAAAPFTASGAGVGRPISDDSNLFEVPSWAVAANAGSRTEPAAGRSEAAAARSPALEPVDPPSEAATDPLVDAIARVASAIAPDDEAPEADGAPQGDAKAEPGDAPGSPSRAAAQSVDPMTAASSALSELAAGLAASTGRRGDGPLAEPPSETPAVAAAPALPSPAPIPLVAPEAVFESTVTKLVKPMLEKWLAENMPRIIENALRAEVGETLGAAQKKPGT